MKSQLFGAEHAEAATATGERWVLQNERMLKVAVDGEFYARQGSMVAYQGDVTFEFQGGGIGKFLKKAITGEGLPLMKVSGKGDVFLAEDAQEVHLVYLENDSMTVNGSNLLGFENGIEWDVTVNKSVGGLIAGGLVNTKLTGTGWVALTSYGTPVVLKTDIPTFADAQSAIAWSSTISTSIKKSGGLSKAMIGRGSGELFQIAFQGDGWVIVQASEGRPIPTTTN